MARKQANRLVNLNFDSLTDTITNLTGTLILVVVLVVGITGRAGRGGSGRTADALLQQLAVLQQHARQVDQRTKDLQTQVTALESRARAAPTGAGQVPAGPASEKPRATPAEKPPAGPKPQPSTPPRLLPSDDRQVQARGARFQRAVRRGYVENVPHGSRAANCRTAPDVQTPGEQVRAMTTAIRQTIEHQSGRLKTLREQIEQLRQLASVEPRTPDAAAKRQPSPSSGVAKAGEAKGGRQDAKGKPPASSEKKPVKQFVYRPPIEQFTTKTPIRFVCQENRVSVLPPDETIGDKIAALAPAGPSGDDRARPFEFDLPDHDFRFRGEAGKSVARFEAVRKSDRPGETAEAIRQIGSKFRDAMKGSPQCSPKTHCVLFYVWPDSYEVYRQARALVWETRVEGLQYSDGWEVMLPADPIRFVRQPGRNVHVVQPH